MATHSSILAWRIPARMNRGASGLPSMGLHRVGHDRSDLAAAAVIHLYVQMTEFLLPMSDLTFWVQNSELRPYFIPVNFLIKYILLYWLPYYTHNFDI